MCGRLVFGLGGMAKVAIQAAFQEEGVHHSGCRSPFFGFHVGHHVGQMVKMLADMMADMKILKMPINHGFFCSTESCWPT